jgi:hypothetical protein
MPRQAGSCRLSQTLNITMKFSCSGCNEEHDLVDVSFGANAPAQWNLITDAERTESDITNDQCVIKTKDEIHFFIRGCLQVPVKETNSPFVWGVWCSLSEESFFEIHDHWDDPNRTKLGPYFGWLCTKIPTYPDTVFLKARVHLREVGSRPLIELEKSDHLLSQHQHCGIPAQEMQKIVEEVMHAP